MLSASVGLTWYAWFTNGYHEINLYYEMEATDWWPGGLGFFAGLGFIGSIFVFRRKPLLAEQIFILSWLLVSINVVAAGDDHLASVAEISGGLWLRESEAILITRSIIVRSFTVPVVLLPLFLLRTQLLFNVFRSPLNRLFFLTTLCDSVLLIVMIRYQLLCDYFM